MHNRHSVGSVVTASWQWHWRHPRGGSAIGGSASGDSPSGNSGGNSVSDDSASDDSTSALTVHQPHT
jgi:hypothetical protein